MQNAFELDLRQWIEGEGAYSFIVGKKIMKGNQEYERLIQKTLRSQIENILLKRGFQVEILREPQLLDDKRTDFLVRYGFAGPIVVEVKLSSNSDLKRARVEASESYISMERYMQGYGASHGVFLIINNTEPKNEQKVKTAFQRITGVWVLSMDCSLSVRNPKGK